MRTTLLATIAAATALAVAGCGSDTESEPDAGATARSSRATGTGADRAFVAAMIPHHESAVEMARIAQDRGTSTFVKQLADDIVRTQNAEINTMRAQDQELAAADVKSGSLGVPEHMMGMDDEPAMLKTADPFDREFLTMMIPHHQGAVTMAGAELAKGEDRELKQLAREIADAQQREIRAMRAELSRRAAA